MHSPTPLISVFASFSDMSTLDYLRVVVDIMAVHIVAQKVLTLVKLLRCWQNKNLELLTRWVIIDMGKGIVIQNDHCSIFCLFLTIDIEGENIERCLHVIYTTNGLDPKVQNNFITRDMIFPIMKLIND